MKKHLIWLAILCAATAVHAQGRPWQGHADPYTFLFGNHIDTHQETRLTNDGSLQGFFYVYWTGDVTPEGLPVAAHCTAPEHYAAGCFAGWRIVARPCIAEVDGCEAMFLYHNHDHPVWLVGPRLDGEGNLRGSRSRIVQPGSFTHFHWLTEGSEHQGEWLPSSVGEIEALFGVEIEIPAECNVAMAGALTPGAICPGYFLELQATQRFAFRHGGETIPVRQGIDNRTHLNLVTSVPAGH